MCIDSGLKAQIPRSNYSYTCCFYSSFFMNTQVPSSRPGSVLFHFINISLLVVMGVLLFPASGRAWEVSTHEELTKHSINIKEGELNTYLKNNLDLDSGLNEVVDGKTSRKWMIEGSNTEDNGIRFVNHFHEPLSNLGSRIFSGISAIEWSLKPVGTQGGDSFSWRDAREYYFKALTAPTKEERDENWGKTFRALGQVMHLIQDSGNPSHVRDDSHPIADGLHDFMARKSVASYPGATFFTPDPSLLQTAHSQGPPDPFANLFDTNTYNGNNPGATLGTTVGITEYTSANFFSDDTISGQVDFVLALFPNAFELVPGPSNLSYLTLPRLGSSTFPAARAAKLTGNQAAAQFLLTNTHFDLIGKLELDDAVYDAQAQNLIPRAIDYSAAVLDYFFRPQFTFEPSFHEFIVLGIFNETGCTMIPDPASNTGSLDVRFTIPSDLNFSNGTVSIYYEKSDGTRVLNGEWTNPPTGQEISLGGGILHSEIGIDQPVRWYLVFDGHAGPGVQEERAILANTDDTPWEYRCLS